MWGEEGSERKSCKKAAQKATSACLGKTGWPSDDKGHIADLRCRHNGASWFTSAWTSWPHQEDTLSTSIFLCQPSTASESLVLSQGPKSFSPKSHIHSAATLFPRRFRIFSSEVLAFPTCWERAVINFSTEVSISNKYLPPTPSLFGCVFWGLSPQTELYK